MEGVIDGMHYFTHRIFYVETMKGDSFVLYIQDGSDLSVKAKAMWKNVANFFKDNESVKIGLVMSMILWENLGITLQLQL